MAKRDQVTRKCSSVLFDRRIYRDALAVPREMAVPAHICKGSDERRVELERFSGKADEWLAEDGVTIVD
jgi:hypothetical protein